MTFSTKELEEITDFITTLARKGGKLALDYFGRVDARLKEDRSFVTDADLAVEEMLLEAIGRQFPDHLILSEESQELDNELDCDPDSPPLWAIDPIDGTDAFRASLPVWGISISLLLQGEPLLGVIHLPLVSETYSGIPGIGATLNGSPIQTCDDKEIDDLSLLFVPSDYHRRFQTDFPGKIRAMGSAAAHVAYVARGTAAGCLTEAYIWDLSAGMAIVKAAGGVWRHLDGSEVDLCRHLGREMIKPPVIISNRWLLDKWGDYITERG